MKRFCCISSVIILIFFSTLLLSGERAVGSSVAANVITTAVGTGLPSGNTLLRTLEKKIFQDMERGQFNPSDVERLKREQEKAFLESGGDPRDIEALSPTFALF